MSAATLNFPFYQGVWQNQGTAAMTMVVGGTPYFTKEGKTVGLRQSGASGVQSNAVIACPIDVTASFTVETTVKLIGGIFQYIMYQVQGGGLGGGWDLYFNGVSTLGLATTTAAAGLARYATATLPQPIGVCSHIVATLDCVGLTGQIWVDNVPLTTAFVNTAPPVTGTSVLYLGSASPSNMLTERFRAWNGSLDTNERQTLYNAYNTLTVNARV
jgi:hypothetical protein